MLMSDAHPVLAADLAPFRRVEEVSHDGVVVKGSLVIVQSLDLDKADAAIPDSVFVIVTMSLLDEDFIFEARHVRGNIVDGLLISQSDASCRAQYQRGSGARGNQSILAMQLLRQICA